MSRKSEKDSLIEYYQKVCSLLQEEIKALQGNNLNKIVYYETELNKLRNTDITNVIKQIELDKKSKEIEIDVCLDNLKRLIKERLYL